MTMMMSLYVNIFAYSSTFPGEKKQAFIRRSSFGFPAGWIRVISRSGDETVSGAYSESERASDMDVCTEYVYVLQNVKRRFWTYSSS